MGDTHYAASPSSSDIQTAIDAASDSDTVSVPSGSVTWTSNVTIPSTKGIRLIAAGIGLTNINQDGTYGLSAITRSTNSPVRISGFSFTNCASAFDGASLVIGDYTKTLQERLLDMGPHYGNFHVWQERIKQAFDPQDCSDRSNYGVGLLGQQVLSQPK